jgi:small subunit ribosomal protein S9
MQESQEGAELNEQQEPSAQADQDVEPTADPGQEQPEQQEVEQPAADAVETATADEPAGVEEPPSEEPPSEEPPSEEPPSEELEAGPPAEEEERPRELVELASEARYFATGKRKSSVARVIVRPGNGAFDLNGRSLEVYFPRPRHQSVVRQPLEATGYLERVDIRARIHGGGISGQAGAVRHGIAKALIEVDPNLRGELKRRQFLTRDPRVKERRKAGLKKARKRPQFSKR